MILMNCNDKLFEIVTNLKSPRFKNEKLRNKLMLEILDIHFEILNNTRLNRNIKRRIKKAWSYGLPLDTYEQLRLKNGLEARHIELIIGENNE